MADSEQAREQEELESEEEEQELEEEQDDDDEGDEEEDGVDLHPADRIADCVSEILNQEKRLSNKNAGSIKWELTNNIYPLLRIAFSAMVDFIDAMESREEQEEVEDQVRKAVEENVKIAIDNCRKLVKIDEEFGEQIVNILSETGKEYYRSVVGWAKSSIESTQHQH